MNQLLTPETVQPQLTDPRRELVQRIASSPGFEKSPRLKAFLIYVTDRAIACRPDEVSEQQIGIRVFSRSAGYNAGDDNIVRSQARVLRWKLEEYFNEAGRDEPVVVTIPKGTYLPVFEPRAGFEPVRIPPPVVVTRADAPSLPQQASRTVLIPGILVLVLSAACIWLVTLRHAAEPALPGAVSFAAFWDVFLGANRRTVAVLPDEGLALLQIAARRRFTLSEYTAADFDRTARELTEKTGLEALIPGFIDKDLTSTFSLTDIASVTRLPHAPSATLEVRNARFVRLADLNAESAILSGTSEDNPWIQLYESQLDFHYGWDNSRKNYAIDRHPKPGQQAEYDSTGLSGLRTVYGGVALLPSLNRRGDVLLILGTAAANKMAAEFITNEKLCVPFLNRIKAESGRRKLPYFEVLLRTTSIKTDAATTEVAAYRIHPD